jgi:hypothetical protein
VRREWENLEKFLGVIAAVWLIVGCIVFGVVAQLNQGPHGEGIHGPGVIALCAWLGPFLIAGLLYAFEDFVGCVAESIPRRIQKPVLEDLRDARKRGAA